MIRNLYLVTLTEEGLKATPRFEIVSGQVVRAEHPRQARRLASEAAIDEGPHVWLNPLFSKVSKIGLATKPGPSEVILTDSNAT